MLRGKRVTLRSVERDDMKRFHELERNVELVLLADGHWQPTPLAAIEKDFEKHLDREEKAWFVIEVGGVVIGGCGLHHMHRRDGSTEFGIGIYDPEYVGKGYGREAIGLLLRWAFQVENWRRVGLTTLACNERAIQCYRALGFVEEGRMREQAFFGGQYVDVLQMGMLRREWEARQP
ncbi:MAG TPA: GNAT family protein [Kouleothrix sp.]|uniref:GNAT family N-acetyltransferase n=1 Tax=Kouleothrix sp. TaxID=2779161 RepID=UPI002CB33742|nr:GNAT family protein [Kouleothrix sp.]HRC75250.1 GNAT family protein [Kouleothrix sp.]